MYTQIENSSYGVGARRCVHCCRTYSSDDVPSPAELTSEQAKNDQCCDDCLGSDGVGARHEVADVIDDVIDDAQHVLWQAQLANFPDSVRGGDYLSGFGCW